MRSGAAPPVLAALRNLVSGLLRLAGHSNIAAALRHYGGRDEAALHLLDFPLSLQLKDPGKGFEDKGDAGGGSLPVVAVPGDGARGGLGDVYIE